MKPRRITCLATLHAYNNNVNRWMNILIDGKNTKIAPIQWRYQKCNFVTYWISYFDKLKWVFEFQFNNNNYNWQSVKNLLAGYALQLRAYWGNVWYRKREQYPAVLLLIQKQKTLINFCHKCKEFPNFPNNHFMYYMVFSHIELDLSNFSFFKLV